MFSLALIKSLQVYGIAIVISMVVAVLIKLLVVLTGRAKKVATVVAAPPPVAQPVAAAEGVPGDVIAAVSAAIAVCLGPHRILHITESKRSWATIGRAAQHSSHQPRH